MCGILGFTILKSSTYYNKIPSIAKELFTLSESRGKEASGYSMNNGKEIKFLRTPFSATELVKSKVFNEELINLTSTNPEFFSLIGHSRLVTNGYEHENKNNQPVITKNTIAVHNGIIVNVSDIWEKYPFLERTTDLDSEIISALIDYLVLEGKSYQEAVKILMSEIYGMSSIAMMFGNNNNLLLSTNNGSLYYSINSEKGIFIFGSEKLILTKLIKNQNLFELNKISQILPLKQLHVSNTLKYSCFKNSNENTSVEFKNSSIKKILENKKKVSEKAVLKNSSLEHHYVSVSKDFVDEVTKRINIINQLKRCKKCVLPSTFPFIKFDSKGVCNYCNGYKPIQIKSKENFLELANKHKSSEKYKHDCLIALSGGRDSCYTLHYIKKVLGMNPLAYSYDWGMLTDLARRNQARMCGKLGVEHILISADIRKKRENIRKNVVAWLNKPHLGAIPLFMAGDKKFFYYANLLMKQNNLKLSFMGENKLEATRFKTGFAGVAPNFDKNSHIYSLSNKAKLQLLMFYAKQFLSNPGYINSSLLDSIDAFKSFYLINHLSVNIFDYIKWNENTVDDTLINGYDWEVDVETPTTWRIGDGTVALYNFIYFMVSGFTENDTFRSNQVREGLISREVALDQIKKENNPRWNSIQWYCNTINLDWEGVVKKIYKIATLYHY